MLDQEFKLKPSNIFLFCTMGIMVGSIVITMVLPILIWVRLFLFFLIVIYGGGMLSRFVLLKSQYSIQKLVHHQNGQWELAFNHRTQRGQVLGDSTLTSFVSVLRFKLLENSAVISCVIFRDALCTNQYRRLLMLIKN